jgi:hypothetical protein
LAGPRPLVGQDAADMPIADSKSTCSVTCKTVRYPVVNRVRSGFLCYNFRELMGPAGARLNDLSENDGRAVLAEIRYSGEGVI